MHIPSIAIAAKTLAGLDQTRRDFAGQFADRISLLPPESLHDDKLIRAELLLELQSRFTPEEAARISYTSSDVLVSISLSIVNERHKEVRDQRRLSLAWRVAGILLVLAACIVALIHFSSSPEPTADTTPPAARK
jgi:hypothetical protein